MIYKVKYILWVMVLLGVSTSSEMAAHMAVILDFTKNSNLSGKPRNCKYFLLEL